MSTWLRAVELVRPLVLLCTFVVVSARFGWMWSVPLHELHHRRPKIPAALLPEHRGLLDTTAPSRCAERLEERGA